MKPSQLAQVETIVRPLLTKSFVFDVSDSDALTLLEGGTIWARIKGDSSFMHIVGLDSTTPYIALGRSS